MVARGCSGVQADAYAARNRPTQQVPDDKCLVIRLKDSNCGHDKKSRTEDDVITYQYYR